MIVCDWNGTLFSERLEETFFLGLCRRATWRAVKRVNLVALARLAICGMRCFGHYLLARRYPRRVPYHIGRIMDLLNRNVLGGLAREELDDYARRYARRIQSRLDRRLLDPLAAVRAESQVILGVISSGCREGITAALADAGAGFDFVRANAFRMEAGAATEFEFTHAADKHEELDRVLAEWDVPRESVMFIGDSPQDEQCLREVGYPVVSFFAAGARRQQLAEDCGAFVPADQEDFRRHIDAALSGR